MPAILLCQFNFLKDLEAIEVHLHHKSQSSPYDRCKFRIGLDHDLDNLKIRPKPIA